MPVDYDPLPSRPGGMIESDYIARLIRWLESCGVRVEPYATDLPCSGLYRSETREIFLNCPGARDALLVLAHEAGHWLGHELFGAKEHSYQRERQAQVYGWRILGLIGATRIVTRAEWIEHHRGYADQPVPDTSGYRRGRESRSVLGSGRMKRVWAWVVGILGTVAAVLAFLLYRKYQKDQVNSLKDALAVAKAERDIKALDAKRAMVDERIEERAVEIDSLDEALVENQRTIVEARTGAKDLTKDEVLAEYRRLGYIK